MAFHAPVSSSTPTRTSSPPPIRVISWACRRANRNAVMPRWKANAMMRNGMPSPSP